MRTQSELPTNYKETFSVDLQKDKKMALKIYLCAFCITVAMIFVMNFFIPIVTLFSVGGLWSTMPKYISMILLYCAYIVLHELVHGVAMKLCGTKKVKYGFTLMYAYAGSDDYYDKKGYIFIALAPVVLWGVVLGIVNFLVPVDWFWVIWFIQIGNISGAAGDFYVTFKFLRMPRDILVRDKGVSMTVYSKY